MATLDNLTDREKEVLKYVVENFIRSANPIGSRSVSRQTDLHLSSATIRNVMCDLEEMDLLGAPHTSAGRVPTDRGYRYYCLLYTSPSPRDRTRSRMPSSA